MKEKRINILFIFILLTGFAFAQPNELDSLKIAAKTQKVDTLRFNALMSLGNNFQGDINDSAIHYHTIAAQLAVEKKPYTDCRCQNFGMILRDDDNS